MGFCPGHPFGGTHRPPEAVFKASKLIPAMLQIKKWEPNGVRTHGLQGHNLAL